MTKVTGKIFCLLDTSETGAVRIFLLQGTCIYTLYVSSFLCDIFRSAQTDLSVDDLPSALLKPTFCDTCAKKGKPHKTANVYCIPCDMKYCAAHREVCHVNFSTALLWSW